MDDVFDIKIPTAADLEELAAQPTEAHEHKSKARRERVIHKARRKAEHNIWSNYILDETLRRAACNGDIDKVRECLDDGANVNSADEKRRTALHFASTKGIADLVTLLLSRGADTKMKDFNGNTALHLAACSNNIDVITALLKGGCDIHSVDRSGHTPIEYAQSHLKFLAKYHKSSIESYRSKIVAVVNLLKEYLKFTGDSGMVDDVTVLGDRLAATTTIDQVDELQVLLQTFTTMTIDRKRA